MQKIKDIPTMNNKLIDLIKQQGKYFFRCNEPECNQIILEIGNEKIWTEAYDHNKLKNYPKVVQTPCPQCRLDYSEKYNLEDLMKD